MYVIKNVEKIKAIIPDIIEFERRANKTLMPTLPKRIVVNKKLESFLASRIFFAVWL